MPESRTPTNRRRTRIGTALCAVATVIAIAPLGVTATAASAAADSTRAFSLTTRAGWHAQPTAVGRIDLAGPGGARGVIWPVYVPSAVDTTAEKAVIARLLAAAPATRTQHWTVTAAQGALVTARGTGADGARGSAILTISSGSHAASGVLYAGIAPRAATSAAAHDLAAMFASFRIAGTAATSDRPATLSYTRWTDPKEGAFSFEAPRGWTVLGGLNRRAPTDFAMGAIEVSPDKTMVVHVGDNTIPAYIQFADAVKTLPGFSAFKDGMKYNNGYFDEVVMTYMPGLTYATAYADALARAGECSDTKAISARSRPDLVAAMNKATAIFQAVGTTVQMDAGEIAFSCTHKGVEWRGYVIAVTRLVWSGQYGMWEVPHLFAAAATAGHSSTAMAALSKAAATYAQNPQWLAMQSGVSKNSAQIAAREGAEVSSMLTSSAAARSAAQDSAMAAWSDRTLDLVDAVDDHGTTYKIESGPSFNWVGRDGTIVGTDTSTKPGYDVDWNRLVVLG